MPPSGQFRTALGASRARTHVAIAAGSGITPILPLAMTTLAAEPRSRFVLIYGNRSAASTMFRDELRELQQQYPQRFELLHCLSRPAAGDSAGLLGGEIHGGRIEPAALAALLGARVAHGPGEVWCWDVTWLPTPVVGRWFCLYLILDIYSRKIVGHEVHEVEAAEHAAHLVKRTALAEGVHVREDGPVLHGDNGGILKATTVLAMLHWHWLGIAPSYSRPRVSGDNAFVESLFRTAKYRPGYPANGFKTLDDARQWAERFVHWYNHDRRHSGIRYVAPAQRHTGHDHARSWPSGTRCIRRLASAIPGAGRQARGTGRRSVPSRSIPSAMLSCRSCSPIFRSQREISGNNYLDAYRCHASIK